MSSTPEGVPVASFAQPVPGGSRSDSVRWPLRPLPLHPLLLAAYPILFLFAENLSEVSVGDVIPPVGRAMIAALTVMVVAGVLLRDLRRGSLIASALVIAWFAFGHVAGLLAPMHVTRDQQLVGWGIFLLAALVGAIALSGRWIARLTSALDVVSVVLAVLALISIVPFQLSHAASAAGTVTSGKAHPGDRDIYYFIFDRYGSDDSLDILTGLHNDLPDWLASRGFAVAPRSHSNYGRTTLSLAATLNLTTLDALAARMGPETKDLTPVYELLQDHAVGRYLEARGYRYIHLGSWFAPTKTARIANENPQMTTSTDFAAILDQTTFGPTLTAMRNLPDPPTHHVLHRSTVLWQLHEFETIRQEPGPKFVFSHFLLPHEPYVFDAKGDYPSLEVQKTRTEGQGYEQQLIYTNSQIRRIVDELLSGPEETRPIIIIQADEGPYPAGYAADQIHFDWSSATSGDLEMKYGILNAMYLPGAPPPGAPEPYATMTSWNTWPIILDRYFGEHLPLLPDRSYTSKGLNQPYDLTDITDRLPSLDGVAIPTFPPADGAPGPGDTPAPGSTPVPRPTGPQPSLAPGD